MQLGALAPYEQSLRTRTALGLRAHDGDLVTLDVARWLAGVDGTDEAVLARCAGPVLDVGCGPGRFVSALNARGVPALGVDIAETAVALTRGQGMPVLHRSVFGDLPGEGRWPTALLMDGNIGIGGDPARLLARIGALLAPGGRLIVETDPRDDADELVEVCFTSDGAPVGPVFDWAYVGRAALVRYAGSTGAGYSPAESWSAAGRAFTTLTTTLAR